MAPTAAVLGLAAPVALFLAGCGDESTTAAPSGKNIADLALDTPELKTLVEALNATDLLGAVSAADPKKTVFAPVNEAFDALGNETLNCLLAPVGLPTLSNVLKYHVVPEEATAADLKNGESLATLDGKNNLTVSISNDTVTIMGGSDSANVTAADIMATNGVVHEVNAVLIPADFVAPQCGSAGNIAELAIATDSLSTLVAALKAADLVSTFTGDTVYTVFAPVDEAFTALGNETLTCLLDPANKDALTEVLTYHVVAGYDLASDITDGLSLETLEKENITFTIKDKSVIITPTTGSDNDATVTAADNFATNGVVHIIDKVLIPKDFADNNPCSGATAATSIVV